MTRVLVCGAAGRMGREVVKAVHSQTDMEVVAGVDLMPSESLNQVPFYTDLGQAIKETKPDVAVDFTQPHVLLDNVSCYYNHNLRAVIGTTGLSQAEILPLQEKAKTASDWAVLIAPNFAIGAVLMMRFAADAAKYFPDVEIIEFHHEQKKDAPSGTAIKTAEMIAAVQGRVESSELDEYEKLTGARGAELDQIHIHSVRLPGYVAHQEVIFGAPGQNLIIRHDSTHRESFMPGVLLAVRKIRTMHGLTYGLEHIL